MRVPDISVLYIDNRIAQDCRCEEDFCLLLADEHVYFNARPGDKEARPPTGCHLASYDQYVIATCAMICRL